MQQWGQFVFKAAPTRGHLFIASVTLYAYDAADVMDNSSFITALESWIIILFG